MDPVERRNAILKINRLGENLVVDEVAARFAVSRETIRRDLSRLDADGLLRRVHGGAVAPRLGGEPPFQDRQRLNIEAKRRIGIAAAALFEPGESLMIDTGSTTEMFAAALSIKPNMTIITNSTRIASCFGNAARKSNVFVLGGAFHHDSGQILGSLCIEQLERFNAAHAVLGAGAISGDGRIMDFDADEAMLAREIIKRTQTVSILADHSKFNRSALTAVCALQSVTRLVTDQKPPESIQVILSEFDVELVVAGTS